MPCWLRRAVRIQHRHAIEQASRRWREGRCDDSARTRRKILISTQVGNEDRLKAQFDKHASEAMKLLLEDVTAHRYFEGVHLEPALKELGLAGLGPDPPTLIEAELSGGGADDSDEVTLSLIFYSPECPYKLWAALDRKGTLDAFFSCNAEVEKISQPEKKLAVRLSVLKPAQTPAAAVPIASAPAAAVEASAAPVEGAVAR